MPPENVTAWPSAMPTSKVRSGMAFIIMFMEQPVGMAGVTPTIFSFRCASSSSVWPNTSWNFGAVLPFSPLPSRRSPDLQSNLPGACHIVASFSAGAYPLPLVVMMCRSLGPFMSFTARNMRTSSSTLCPSMHPKYLMSMPSNMLWRRESTDLRLLPSRMSPLRRLSVSMPHFRSFCESLYLILL